MSILFVTKSHKNVIKYLFYIFNFVTGLSQMYFLGNEKKASLEKREKGCFFKILNVCECVQLIANLLKIMCNFDYNLKTLNYTGTAFLYSGISSFKTR